MGNHEAQQGLAVPASEIRHRQQDARPAEKESEYYRYDYRKALRYCGLHAE